MNKKYRDSSRFQHKKKRNKLEQFVLILGGVIIIGGIFFIGWSLGSAQSQKTDTSSLETTGSDTTELPTSSYLPEIPRIDVATLKAELDTGTDIAIIDSRSRAAYEGSHIAGAISMPLRDMSEPYDELDVYDEIITYCD